VVARSECRYNFLCLYPPNTIKSSLSRTRRAQFHRCAGRIRLTLTFESQRHRLNAISARGRVDSLGSTSGGGFLGADFPLNLGSGKCAKVHKG
jgi:hypothetical protein